MKIASIKILTFTLFLTGFAANASVVDETLKALIDNSYKTEKKIDAMQKQINASNLKIEELEKEIARLKVESRIVNIDTKEHNNSLQSEEVSNIVVTVWAAHIRKNPNRDSAVVGYGRMGDILSVFGLSKNKEWYKTKQGYIKKTLAEPIDVNASMIVIPVKKTINIRKYPVFKKDNISVTASDVNAIKVYPVLFLGKWYKLKNGQGYVHKKVVKEVK
jgi:cell division protein FtsL